jgi:hypothetical protein
MIGYLKIHKNILIAVKRLKHACLIFFMNKCLKSIYWPTTHPKTKWLDNTEKMKIKKNTKHSINYLKMAEQFV